VFAPASAPALVLLLAVLCAAALPARASGIFDAAEQLPVVLEFPLQRLLREKAEKIEYDGRLHYRDDVGELVSLRVEVRARGHKRLALCPFPPLRLDFKKKSSAGTLFAGIDALKLVPQCGRRQRYQDYLVLEYLIYRAWERLSPYAFRTRALEVSYRDTESGADVITRPAFLIEDIDDLARRLDTRRIRRDVVEHGAYYGPWMNLLELFQYLIGNLDWSAYDASAEKKRCCHNGRIVAAVEDRERFALVPYDFDFSGLVNADYATVNPMFRAHSVRHRIYRGLCRHNSLVPQSVVRLNSARPEIESLFADERLGNRASRDALGYIGRFYRIVNDPDQLQRHIYDQCRRDP
jgi:hypothetical protein